jgi:hypothetical protein
MRIELEYNRTETGGLLGTLCADNGEAHPFVGTLDLLRLLDELAGLADTSRPDAPPDEEQSISCNELADNWVNWAIFQSRAMWSTRPQVGPEERTRPPWFGGAWPRGATTRGGRPFRHDDGQS